MVPPGQAQPPLTQEVPVGQTIPQAPQLLLSLVVLTQRPPQSVCPETQPQRPAVHTWPVRQTIPQAPQLDASLDGMTQRLEQ